MCVRRYANPRTRARNALQDGQTVARAAARSARCVIS